MLLSNYNDTVLYIIITLRQQKILIGKIIDKPFQTLLVIAFFIMPVYIFLFQHRYNNNPTSLYTIVRHCLHAEMDLVQKAEMVSKNMQ